MWKLLRDGHTSAKHMRKTDAPLRKVGEGDKRLTPDPDQMVENQIRPFGRL
jgi:hypothetical protein